jgi:hypothetical protein
MSIFDTVVGGIGTVGGFFFEETEVARYVTVAGSEAGFTIPSPTSPENDRHIQQIQAPGLVLGPLPVIFFRTAHTGTPQFQVRLNSTVLTRQTLAAETPRTWHQIVPAGALKAQDNELTLSVTGEGVVTFSDIVILYTSNKLTVRKPPVATQ